MIKLEDRQYYEDIVDNLIAQDNYAEAKEVKQLIAYIFEKPTKEEVCEALTKYFNKKVKMDYHRNFFYTTTKQYYGECDEVICGYGWSREIPTLIFNFNLPPYLTTLIGRFYEGDK
jgi:hypothetical protein